MNCRSLYTGAKKLAALVLCFLLSLLFFVYNKTAQSGAYDGLLLCTHAIIPSLFPFMVITQFIIKNEYSYVLGVVFYPYMHVLRIKSKAAAAVLLLSLLGGFAVAAQLISELYKRCDISRRDAAVLLCCCVNSAPAFVIITVGVAMLKSIALGYMLFAVQTLASLLCGIIFSFLLPPQKENKSTFSGTKVQSKAAEIIRTAALSMLYICGYVVFFSFLTSLLSSVPFLTKYSGIIAVLLEPTTACGYYKAPFACCAALSACGASIILQVRMLLDSEIKMLPLILSRLIHLPVSLLLLKAALRIFPVFKDAAAVTVFPRKCYTHIPLDAGIAIIALMCFIFYSSPIKPLRKHKNDI